MRAKYKNSLKFISLLIAICLFIGIAYFFYDKQKKLETEVVVYDELSTNYMNGYHIKGNGEYNFSITNNSSNDTYFEIAINETTGFEPNIRYDLISSDANINITNATLNNNISVLSRGFIAGKETQNFTFKISNNNTTSFKIIVKKASDTDEYFASTIMRNNPPKKSSTTKVLTENATANEGLIEDVDDSGLTYYFRGAVANNYVQINNNLWRIVRINGDGSVKLVLNELIDDLTQYNETINNYEELENSTITKILESYYDINLKEYDSLIANTKFCSENTKIEETNTKIYNGYTRLIKDNIPTFNCLGTTYNKKIGLLTADEIIYAGATLEAENKEYYLYLDNLENSWWTSTLAEANTTSFNPFSISKEGKIEHNLSGLTYEGVRPVISLIRKTKVTGDGTLNNPYIIVLKS